MAFYRFWAIILPTLGGLGKRNGLVCFFPGLFADGPIPRPVFFAYHGIEWREGTCEALKPKLVLNPRP